MRCTAQIFCRTSFNFDFLILFSWLWSLGRKTEEGKCHSYHIMPKISSITLTYYWCYLAEAVLIRLQHCKVPLFLHFSIVLFEVTTCSSYLRIWELCFFSLRMDYLLVHKLFGILLHRSPPPPFIYLLTYSYKHAFTDIHLIHWVILWH